MDDFKVVFFNKENSEYHSIVSGWHQKRYGVPLPIEICSDFGFMGTHNERCVFAVFAFPVLRCETAIIGHSVSDPDSDKVIRRRLIELGVAEAEKFIQQLGYKFIFSYPGSVESQAMYNRLGYLVGDKEVVHVVKRLKA